MEILKVPSKFKRCGIKIKCLKCKWQVADQCRSKNTRISACEHKNQHRFNLVVCVPNTKSDRKTKILQTRDFNEALIELGKYKEELKRVGYQSPKLQVVTKTNTTLMSLATEYLDSMSGINTPKHLIRVRSKGHIRDCKMVMERFCIVLKNNGYNINIFQLESITDREVELYHSFLTDELKASESSFNKHFVIMKAFINWVVRVKKLKLNNYFEQVQLNQTKTEATNITKQEFETLLTQITEVNGWGIHSEESRNYFKPWIPYAFRLGLHTGTRAEELVCMKWNNIQELENNVLVLKIQNLKVNRIKTGQDIGSYIRYIPITKGLMELLIEMGYHQKKGSSDYILDRETNLSTNYMMTFISRSFAHFIKLATNRKIEFKDLRKTYITQIAMLLGENTKMFTGHSNNEVLKNHYIAQAYLAGNLNNFNIF